MHFSVKLIECRLLIDTANQMRHAAVSEIAKLGHGPENESTNFSLFVTLFLMLKLPDGHL